MKLLSVTSGKGGVGKTNISANLGIVLAMRGKRVVVFDADFELANLDVILGVRPEFNLQHVLTGEKRTAEVAMRGPGGVRYIAGGSGIQGLIDLDSQHLERFLSELADLDFTTDYLIIDTGAGIDATTMTFLEAADDVLLVCTPDPASITDAYATVKALLRTREDPKVRLIVNMAFDEKEGRAVYEKMSQVVQKFLGIEIEYLGTVRYDQAAAKCIRKLRPYVLEASNSNAALDIQAIAARFLGEAFVEQSQEEHRQGLMKRLRSVFGSQSNDLKAAS